MRRWRLIWRWIDTQGPSRGIAVGIYRRTPDARPHGARLRIGRYYYGITRRLP